jgi:nucleoside 2-deoxyribosyltransferase
MIKSNKNVLEKTKTYLCGAMQYKNGEEWRNIITKQLNKVGIIVFNPYDKPFLKDIQEGDVTRHNLLNLMDKEEYDEVEIKMREIRYYDLNLVDRSDFIIANINPSVPTFGSIEELTTAVRMKKPIFLSIEGSKRKCPLWLMGMIPHKYIYDNMDDMMEMIMKINSGEQKIDSNRWRLLKKQYR